MTTAAAKKQETSPTPPTEAAAPPPEPPVAHDILATGPRGLATFPRREPGPQEIAAANTSKELGHVVRALRADKAVPMRAAGACMFAAFMVVHEGRDKVTKMRATDVEAYAAAFRHRYPGAWHASARGDQRTLVRHLRAAAAVPRDLVDTVDKVVLLEKELQSLATTLLSKAD